jgi:hypothetical protein
MSCGMDSKQTMDVVRGTSKTFTKGVGSLGSSLLPRSAGAWSNFFYKYLFTAVIVYLLLACAGPAPPNFLANGLIQSVKSYILVTLPFFVVAWGIVSRGKNNLSFYTGGLFLTATIVYLIFKNLPIASSSPSWTRNGKDGLVDVSGALSAGLVVATAAIVAL